MPRPQPITPIGRQDDYDNAFKMPETRPEEEVYTAQKYFSNDGPKQSEIDMLITIDKYQDTMHTAAAEFVSGIEDRHYKIPTDISDEDIFKLKGSGFISGAGRTVKFTKKGMDSIKKAYLSTENTFKKHDQEK